MTKSVHYKIGDNIFSTLTTDSKNNVIFVHNSGNMCDKTVRFVAYAPFLDTLVMLWRNKKSMTKSVHY